MFLLGFIKFIIILVVAFIGVNWADKKILCVSEDFLTKEDDHKGYKNIVRWVFSFVVAFVLALFFGVAWKTFFILVLIVGGGSWVVIHLGKDRIRRMF